MKAPKVCFVSALYLTLGLFSLAPAETRRLTVSVTDADTGAPIAARLYLTSVAKPSGPKPSDDKATEAGVTYFFHAAEEGATAIQYQKQNWLDRNSTEYHTTISAHRCFAEIPAGHYTLTIERGKSYFPPRGKLRSPIRTSNSISLYSSGAIRLQRAGIQAIHTCTERSMNFVTCYLLKISMSLYH